MYVCLIFLFFFKKMESKKKFLNFCNNPLFFDYEPGDIIDQLNQLLLCIFNEFKANI